MTVSQERLRRVNTSTMMSLMALLAGLLLAFLCLTVLPMHEAKAAAGKRAVSKARTKSGFPVWYQDDRGHRLRLCLGGPPLCLAPRRSLQPPNGEAFWWAAESQMEHVGKGGNGRARLVLAVEAAFAGSKQKSRIAFGRVRVRAENLKHRTRYKVIHPYGVLNLKTDNRGELRYSQDIGAGSPRRFRKALHSRVFGSFLRWNPKVGRKAPRGYLGNPNIPHKVVGSPRGANFFRIKGPNVGGKGDNEKTAIRFSVQGQRR